MDLQSDICFALDCFRVIAWTIIILASSALLTWLLIFRGEEEIGFFVKCEGALAFTGFSIIQVLTFFALQRWWPSLTEPVFIVFWGLILVYTALSALWTFVLEPLSFRISQEYHRWCG